MPAARLDELSGASGPLVAQHRTEHQATAAHLGDEAGLVVQCNEALAQPLALALDVGEQFRRAQPPQHHPRHRGGDRVAAEGRAVAPRLEGLRRPGADQHRPDGQPAAERLREGDHVRDEPPFPLVGEQPSGPAESALDLVEHQQRTMRPAALGDRREEAVLGRHHAPLPLDRLHEHRAGVVPDGLVEGGGVVVAAVPEASRQRPEALLVLRLRGGGHRGEGAAVEPSMKGHDLALLRAVAEARMLARELDRGLVRLRPGVAEEDPVGERRLAQLLGKAHRRLHEVEVAGMPEPSRLIDERLRQLRVAVAEGGHADPGAEVHVLVAVRIPYAGALAAV